MKASLFALMHSEILAQKWLRNEKNDKHVINMRTIKIYKM